MSEGAHSEAAPVYLLDTNALLALAWRSHIHHQRARAWFKTVTQFSTCPITQLGLVRISPIAKYSLDLEQAKGVLEGFTNDKRHIFWPCDIPLRHNDVPAVEGHQLLTDAYLCGLAAVHGGRLATLDERLGRYPQVDVIPLPDQTTKKRQS